jgi:hypothetical protein
MTYLTIVHWFWVVKSGLKSLYVAIWGHRGRNFLNWYACSSNSNVDVQCVFKSIIRCTAVGTLAFWHWMNLFWWPGLSVINTASILCYMTVNFRTFKILWNMYIPNYLCQTWSHDWHLIDSSVAHFSKSLTLPSVYAFIHSKLLIALMGFPRLGAALSTVTAYEGTGSQLYDAGHACHVVSYPRRWNSGVYRCWLHFVCHRQIWGRILSPNNKLLQE